MKQIIASDGVDIGWRQRMIAGATAGVIAQAAIYPMEVIKVRYESRSLYLIVLG